MTRPVVGLTTYADRARWGSWDVPAHVLHAWYADRVAAAGGAPVLLPPPDAPADDADAVAAAVAGRLDGLVLTGGADVDPARYGEAPHPATDAPRAGRDAAEAAWYAAARAAGLPVLGVCRGLQVMAVASGGRLAQHLPDVSGLDHRPGPGAFCDHPAHLVPGSRVAAALGATHLVVNSSHHQAVADAGTLAVVGRAADGTVEAAEDPGAPFVVGVQWHPEHPGRAADDAPLWAAFVAACAARAAGR